MTDDELPEGEHGTLERDGGYTRIKGKLQCGDGPDARGEVTIEMVRGVDHDDHDTLFGEYVLEANRAVKHTREVLGLEESDDEEHR